MLIGNPKNEKGIPLDGIDSITVGAIVMFAGLSSIPNGFLLCDGSELSRETYPELFSVIGTTWGSGDGVNTFNLPDIVNKTVWGGNNSEIGTYLSAGLPNITGEFIHSGSYCGYDDGVFLGAFSSKTRQNLTTLSSGSGNNSYPTGYIFNAGSSNIIYGNSNTVQPPAAVFVFYIKYE